MYERNKKKRLSERYVLNKIGGDNMEKTCFVIMPFSKTTDNHDERYWTDFFEMLKTIMEDNGYLCIRSEVGPYKLFLNIVTHIQKSDIVIAVLTDFNSNVWYELGIRHTLKTGTIMLLQEGQTPSFDIRDFGIIFYKETPKLKEQLQKKIEEYLSKMSVDVNDSPVISAINNRAFNGIEKKLEEMEKLIWGLVNESSPRHEQKQYDSRGIVHKILWVDDYPANNEGIMTLLESKNIHCDIAISTSQGMELFRNRLYDIVITDMGRGVERDAGLALIEQLNAIHCKVPIIVFASDNAIRTYGARAYELGAHTVTSGVFEIIHAILEILRL